MNINKFTQKSIQALQDCEKVALDNGNQEIAQEHFLYALLSQDDSLIVQTYGEDGLRFQCTYFPGGADDRETSQGTGRQAVYRPGS